MVQKLTSRKFWMAVSSIVSGILMMMNFSDNFVSVISGGVLVLSGTIVYIVTEGKIDAARVQTSIETIMNIIEAIEEAKTKDSEPEQVV